MEETKIKNPKAFPGTHEYYDYRGRKLLRRFDGMTLRDYFAAKALQGFCSDNTQWLNIMMDSSKQGQHKREESSEDYLAHQMYRIADSMLKERNNSNE